MSEIPLESIFNEEPTNESEVFIEKGSNGGETKETKPGENVTTTSTRIVTTSRTVVKGDGAPVTTVEKKVIVNGEEQPVDSNLLSPPALDVEVEEKDDGSEEGKGCLPEFGSRGNLISQRSTPAGNGRNLCTKPRLN